MLVLLLFILLAVKPQEGFQIYGPMRAQDQGREGLSDSNRKLNEPTSAAHHTRSHLSSSAKEKKEN